MTLTLRTFMIRLLGRLKGRLTLEGCLIGLRYEICGPTKLFLGGD